MSGVDLPPVWIGTPQREAAQEDVADPYTSKIGGQAVYFRVGASATEQQSSGALSKYFQCPQCKSTAQVSLLCQVYAPLEVYDRVLYILVCAACTRRPTATAPFQGGARMPALTPGSDKKSGLAAAAAANSHTSFCFALRSQNFSREYFAELQQRLSAEAQKVTKAEKEKAENDAPLFSVSDDWDRDDEPSKEARPSPAAPQDNTGNTDGAVEKTPEEQPTFPLASRGMTAPLKGVLYTSGLALDLYEEPPPKWKKEPSIKEQLAAAESMYNSSVTLDTSGFEEDDESPAEACVRAYMEQMERTPSQCVRWCPGGTPLRTSTMPIGVNGGFLPPPCPACGATRQFEMQLTAPVVYYLTKDIDEVKNLTVHFSNVLVYTCSSNCYSTDCNLPYLPEYVVVEDEL
ncbi:putative Programmed cell death protein 2, C-terminal putative domain containing protein [Leishmania utingensis]|uniref:Programmed cell death protein 2, C-terminal putative domain containing protein n=1 Tax=Leishmania utingensis TaxID=653362 RepID=A0AAW3ANJ1_9TRYP